MRAFLTLAIVMGEFTIANLAAFHTFPIFLQYVNESQGFPAGALTLLSFMITWGAMLSLLLVGRKRGARGAVIAGAQMSYLQLENLHRALRQLSRR